MYVACPQYDDGNVSTHVSGSDGSGRQPDRSRLDQLWKEMQVWQAALNEESEHFTGEVLLTRQEELAGLNNLVSFSSTLPCMPVERDRFLTLCTGGAMDRGVSAAVYPPPAG